MRKYGMLLIGVTLAAVCVRLGLWQLHRLHERRAYRAAMESRLAAPPLGAQDVPALVGSGRPPAGSLAFRRAALTGVFDWSRQIIVAARALRETPGVYVTTPLVLPGGGAILVERGWVYSPDAASLDLSRVPEPDSTTVRGVLLPPATRREGLEPDTGWPLTFPTDDPALVAPRYPYPLAPLVLRRTQPPDAAVQALEPIPLPVLDNGPHLSYAIQWFAFALIAIIGPIALIRKQGRGASY